MKRTLRIAVLVATVLAATTLPSAVRADQPRPVRSGTILGWGYTHPAMYSGEAKECQWSHWAGGGNPECLTWLKSGCRADLAGREPAVSASIIDVDDLADGSTPRTFEWEATRPDQWGFGGAVVQMWTESCTEITTSKWRSRVGNALPMRHESQTSFEIPIDAKWMTVTTNDNFNLVWSLT